MPFLLTRLVKNSGLIAENNNADQVQEKLSNAKQRTTAFTLIATITLNG